MLTCENCQEIVSESHLIDCVQNEGNYAFCDNCGEVIVDGIDYIVERYARRVFE